MQCGPGGDSDYSGPLVLDPLTFVIRHRSHRCSERLDDKAQVLDHLPIQFGSLAGSGQVIGAEEGVGRIQAERLERTQMNFAPGGDAELTRGAGQPEQAQDFETKARI